MTPSKIPISIAYGDGIGPEIMEATLSILREAGAPLEYHEIVIGEKLYTRGILTGIEASSWETLRHTKAFLKAPITTPQGGGFKSLNVTVRSALGLYANVRPCVAYAPFVATKHPQMDLVIVRENEEDLYAGIEYQQTPEVSTAIKLISRPGCEKIVRYAFEYARHSHRKKVTCFIKDNILKITDGLFHRVFQEISKEYPDIQNESWIVDIGAAKLADTPELFDVIVMPNLYGDILSDVAAQISGSVGLAGSANIGDLGAMFEAIHGSAPRRAGQNLANPSGLILASILMLLHLNENDIAERIHNAWLKTLEAGFHTYDIFKENVSQVKVGTQEFAQTVCKFLGEKPSHLPVVSYQSSKKFFTLSQASCQPHVSRELVGVDLFIHFPPSAPALLERIGLLKRTFIPLNLITNRGARIWPDGQPETFCVDQWRLRFLPPPPHRRLEFSEILNLQQELTQQGFEIIKTENLYRIDGKLTFSSALSN